MKSVSIVINTLNRAAYLPRTLTSLRHLDYDNFEIVVVNGPSTDETDQILDDWKEHIKIGSCPEANLSKSRNIGIAMSSGDIVAFVDDDGVPEPEWLDQVVAAFDSEDVAASGGKVFDHTGHRYQFEYSTANRLGNGKWQLTEPSPQFSFPASYEFPYLQGTNTAFRRSALLEIGGFDEAFAYYLDETEVCLRLVDRGYVLRQLANAFVHHKYAPSHIRTTKGAIYRFPVLKSKVYYSWRHGRPYHSDYEIDHDNSVFMERQRADVRNAFAAGILTEAQVEAFEEHVQQALDEGRREASEPARLLTTELLERHRASFKRMEHGYRCAAPLTIVLLCEDYPPDLLGGIARYTQDKATALARLGHKVHVIARSHTVCTVDFEDGVWVHRITADAHPNPGRKLGLDIPKWQWYQSQSFLYELDRVSSHRPVDIVDAPIWNIVGIAPLLSDRYTVVTTLMTTMKIALRSRPDLTDDRQQMKELVRPLLSMEAYMLTKSHGILGISEGIVGALETEYALSIERADLAVAHLGMPDWAKQVDAAERIATGHVDVLFVGRLEKRKGIDVLLDVAPSLVARFPHMRLHIVGDDTIPTSKDSTYRNEFEARHSELCGKNIFFHGKVDEDALRRHYFDCDVFVAPSRFESFGLIYVEAMMFSKPVVGCNVGGIPEVVVDGETGILVEPESPEGLEAALARLVDDAALREKLGRAGRERYEAEFTDVRMAEKSLDFYRSLVARHSSSTESEGGETPLLRGTST